MRPEVLRARRASLRTRAGIVASIALSIGVAATTFAHAAEWPERPVRLVLASGPAGGADNLARLIAPRLADRLAQPVVVENRPGAGGDIGIAHVARSAPDGYTILLIQTALVVNPALRDTGYDPVADFAPVTALVQSDVWLLAAPSFPAHTVSEAIAVARSRSAGLTCGVPGGLLHLGCELFKSLGRLPITTVPYKSSAAAVHDVAIGDVDLAFGVVEAVRAHVQAGRLKVLGSSDSRPARARASGIAPIAAALPGFELMSWQGVVAPAGTPRPIVERLAREFAAVLAEPEIARKLADGGYETIAAGPQAFGRTIATDAERFARLVREAGIRQ